MSFSPVKFNEVLPNSTMEELGLDSLDIVEASMELEDRLGIDLDWDHYKWITVQDLMNSVDEQLKVKQNG